MFVITGWSSLISFIYVAFVVCSQDLKTPLHLAAIEGHAKVLSFLLENGANVNTVDLVSNFDSLDHMTAVTYHDILI
jgi:hypothetical protein